MSDEVSQFLEQVERLRGQQIEEDEVRARELEQYLAAKRERQARREERARSISPQKSSPANTPSPRSSRQSVHLSEALKFDSPQVPSDRGDPSEVNPGSARAGPDFANMAPSSSPTKENEAPADLDGKRTSTLSTGSPLAWQRRPTSRGAGSRPLSMVAAQNATQRSLAGSQEPSPTTLEQSTSKDQIVRALGSKDPSWFRQTPDRGQESAAYRRNQVDQEDRVSIHSSLARLPSMSPQSSRDRSPSPSQGSAALPPALASPLQLSSPKPIVSSEAILEPLRSPTGRSSPTRSPSPTKGMGGFVQSAMMKRSDSVKRWSVTSPPGLTRSDSVASYRNTPSNTSRPQSMTRASPAAAATGSSRPESCLSGTRTEADATPKAPASDKPNEDPAGIPTSPSKTMDSRRWSPTKSSWLENALSKPETPKSQPKPQPSQPSWMVDLNKNKTERTGNPSPENSLPPSLSHKHQVSIGGLMRSSPLGEGVKPNPPGMGGIYSPPPGGNRPFKGHVLNPSQSQSVPLQTSVDMEKNAMATEESEVLDDPSSISIASSANSKPRPTLKPKPETPPKKDLRANLKQRPPETGGANAEEPEFKNVFGNLRRTKTQNYVAPDELKDNILRGKAALSVTDGPQKTERKDEFKQAILKKKDDFKRAQAQGKGVTISSTTVTEKTVPEGLARRATLGKSATESGRDVASDAKTEAQPSKLHSTKPTPGPKRVSSQSRGGSNSASSATGPGATKNGAPDQLKRVSTEPSIAESPKNGRSPPQLYKESSAPSRLQAGRTVDSKLADRFHPALAGMLARGPPGVATDGVQSPKVSPSRDLSAGGVSSEPSAPGPQLTHMTKNRARGPRRKAPTTSTAPVEPAKPSPGPSAQPAPVHSEPPATPSLAPAPVAKPAHPKTCVLPVQQAILDQAQVSKSDGAVADKSNPTAVHQQVAANTSPRNQPRPLQPETAKTRQDQNRKGPKSPQGKPPGLHCGQVSASTSSWGQEKDVAVPQPGSPKKLDVKRMSRFLDRNASKDELSAPAEQLAQLSPERAGSSSPVKKIERAPNSATSAVVNAGSDAPAHGTNDAPNSKGSTARSPPIGPKPSFDRPGRDVSNATPRAKGSPALLATGQVAAEARPAQSPVRSPKVGELSATLTDFFGRRQGRKPLDVDAAEILARRPVADVKISSQEVRMFQITGDGKKIPVPSHYERVLFEREMYVCAHSFLGVASRRTVHVYFWVGDEVSESAADDAQLFVQREARSLGGKLVRLQQGKETGEFMAALGGVVIVRRGSSTKYDSLAPNMLCGRRHLGQVAFDEVDFTPLSLCSGFAYLITDAGKCFLWKGKGSDVEELSCARLVGMDLALTGEMVECQDGNEPASFWDLFRGGGDVKKPHSADHWKLKPCYSKYGSRLFCSDAESKLQISEITPFRQADLSPSAIYVLDAFFELYVIVGSSAQSQYASFRNALDFAQEYGILAASMEDRPFVPFSTVVLEGIPRDLKSVFRKWTDANSPTVMSGGPLAAATAAAAGLKRAHSLKVVPLTQALQAFNDG